MVLEMVPEMGKLAKWIDEVENKVKDKINAYVNVCIYNYAAIKYVLQKFDVSHKNHGHAVTIALCLITTPILFMVLLLCKVYRFFVYAILKLTKRSSFYALFDGTDTVFAIDDSPASRTVVTTLLLVEFPGTPTELLAAVTSEARMNFSRDKFLKLRCSRRKFMGYYYYAKHDWIDDECVKTFGGGKGAMSAEELQKCMGELINDRLPMDDTGMWDVHVGMTALLSHESGVPTYPLVFRFHHCLGDACTVFNIFRRDFATQKKVSTLTPPIGLEKPRPLVVNNFEDAFIKSFILADAPDRSILCGKQISGDKLISWFSDDSSSYLNLVKDVKKRHGNLAFVEVVLTALSSSLHEFASKKFDVLPKIANAVVTTLMPGKNTFKYGEVEDYGFDNKFTIGFVKMPLKANNTCTDDDLLDRLKTICDEYRILKTKSLDNVFNRWQGKVIFTLIPSCITSYMFKCGEPTVLFSNIPGCDSFEILDGHKVKEFVIFDPNVSTSGISLMVTTYENRLNLAFTFDKSIVSDQEEAEDICNGVLKYLNKLDQIF